jgi:Voltage-dependent anion channel
MATGIVSIGAELQACHRVAVVLFVTHVIAFLVPLLLNLLRVFRYPVALLKMHGHSVPNQPMQQPRTGRLAPAALAPPPGSV